MAKLRLSDETAGGTPATAVPVANLSWEQWLQKANEISVHDPRAHRLFGSAVVWADHSELRQHYTHALSLLTDLLGVDVTTMSPYEVALLCAAQAKQREVEEANR